MKSGAIHRIERLALLLTGVATAITLAATWELKWVLGVALGGLMGVGNFYALRRIVGALFVGGSSRRQTTMAVLLTLKFGVLAASIYLVIHFIPVNAVALLCGISVVVLSIFVEGFRSSRPCGPLRGETTESRAVRRGAEPNFKSE